MSQQTFGQGPEWTAILHQDRTEAWTTGVCSTSWLHQMTNVACCVKMAWELYDFKHTAQYAVSCDIACIAHATMQQTTWHAAKLCKRASSRPVSLTTAFGSSI